MTKKLSGVEMDSSGKRSYIQYETFIDPPPPKKKKKKKPAKNKNKNKQNKTNKQKCTRRGSPLRNLSIH